MRLNRSRCYAELVEDCHVSLGKSSVDVLFFNGADCFFSILAELVGIALRADIFGVVELVDAGISLVVVKLAEVYGTFQLIPKELLAGV